MTGQMFALPPNAVIEKDGQVLTDSLKIAEAFGKRHDRVMRAIKELDCPEEFALPNFGESYYLDKNNRQRPMFEITRDGLTFLVMGFTGPKAAKVKIAFIQKFNAMEQALLQQAFSAQPAPQRTVSESRYVELLEAENTLLRGQVRRRRSFSDQDKRTMRQLRAQGKTVGFIARHLGRNPSSVRGFFKG